MTYYMTSPEGEKFARLLGRRRRSTSHTGFAFRDGFADADLNPNPELPVSLNEYTLRRDRRAALGPSSRARYDSADALQKVLDMGIEEGARTAINQIDGFLANSTQNA